jgi:hypothetical protein
MHAMRHALQNLALEGLGTMHALRFLHTLLTSSLTWVHGKRVQALLDIAVISLDFSAVLTWPSTIPFAVLRALNM